MKEIQSTKNELIKKIKKLHKKKYRQEAGEYLLEGYHLVEEAVKNQVRLPMIFVSKKSWTEKQAFFSNYRIEEATEQLFLVSEEVLATLADSPSPQGIVAVAKIPKEEVTNVTGGWLLLDNIQDPGNVGTMIRTADAAGLTGVILGKGTADLYSSKVLRSTQGSQFHLTVVSQPLEEIISQFKASEIPIYGTELNPAAIAYNRVAPTQDFALIMGNEGQGVDKDLLVQTDQNLYIPLLGAAESLNVGVATGIILYHLRTDNDS